MFACANGEFSQEFGDRFGGLIDVHEATNGLGRACDAAPCIDRDQQVITLHLGADYADARLWSITHLKTTTHIPRGTTVTPSLMLGHHQSCIQAQREKWWATSRSFDYREALLEELKDLKDRLSVHEPGEFRERRQLRYSACRIEQATSRQNMRRSRNQRGMSHGNAGGTISDTQQGETAIVRWRMDTATYQRAEQMKFVVSVNFRRNGSAEENESASRRMLDLYSQWTPPADMIFHQFVGRADGGGTFAVIEVDNLDGLVALTSKFSPFVEYQICPVVDIEETVQAANEAVAFRGRG